MLVLLPTFSPPGWRRDRGRVPVPSQLDLAAGAVLQLDQLEQLGTLHHQTNAFLTSTSPEVLLEICAVDVGDVGSQTTAAEDAVPAGEVTHQNQALGH